MFAVIGPAQSGKSSLPRMPEIERSSSCPERPSRRAGLDRRRAGREHDPERDLLLPPAASAWCWRHAGRLAAWRFRARQRRLSRRVAAGVHAKQELAARRAVDHLRQAALWDEVKDRLHTLGTKLSGGQQQRLTIARALSHEPEVLCLDEFSIAIDPVTTMRIEDVLKELKQHMTIVLVTNLVQQARRLASRTMFLWNGEIVEEGPTDVIFSDSPASRKTYDYVNGIFG